MKVTCKFFSFKIISSTWKGKEKLFTAKIGLGQGDIYTHALVLDFNTKG